jgi:hypothetical protein
MFIESADKMLTVPASFVLDHLDGHARPTAYSYFRISNSIRSPKMPHRAIDERRCARLRDKRCL